jgi:hypothetical protein
MFTGINLAMTGALNSRTLPVRVQVDDLDPANRPFQHPDPLGWTLDHRGEIIHHLYVLLLGNPRLRDENPPQAETRFKDWMHMAGSAVEHGAKEHHARVEALLIDENSACPAAPINFQKIFAAQKTTDETATALAELLALLAEQWPSTPGQTANMFKATDLANLINPNVLLDVYSREKALGDALREFLFPRLPDGKTVASNAVGKKLRIYVDKPVRDGDKTLILKDWYDEHAKASAYFVAVK